MDGAEAGEGGTRSIHGPQGGVPSLHIALAGSHQPPQAGYPAPYCLAGSPLGWVASEESRRAGDRARREKRPAGSNVIIDGRRCACYSDSTPLREDRFEEKQIRDKEDGAGGKEASTEFSREIDYEDTYKKGVVCHK